jgi:hypothetical protein
VATSLQSQPTTGEQGIPETARRVLRSHDHPQFHALTQPSGQYAWVTDRHESVQVPVGRSAWRESVGIILSTVVIALVVIFGKQGGGPDWLLGVLLGLVVAISVVIVIGRRTRREWMVLALVAGTAIAVLVSTVVE